MDLGACDLHLNFVVNNINPILIRVLAFRMSQDIEELVPRMKNRIRQLQSDISETMCAVMNQGNLSPQDVYDVMRMKDIDGMGSFNHMINTK